MSCTGFKKHVRNVKKHKNNVNKWVEKKTCTTVETRSKNAELNYKFK